MFLRNVSSPVKIRYMLYQQPASKAMYQMDQREHVRRNGDIPIIDQIGGVMYVLFYATKAARRPALRDRRLLLK